MTAVEDRCSTLAIQSLESVSRPFNQIMLSFSFPDSTQLTGTPPGPLWSFRRCRASRASSPASCPSPTSPPLKGSIAPMLQELCFSSPVSLATSERSAKHLFLGESWLTQDSLPLSLLCSAGHGHLYGGDSPLPGETLWGLALLLVLHPGLGRHAYDLFRRWKEKKKNTESEIHTVEAKFKRQARETFHLLQVFSTYVPTESVNAGEGTARTRWTQPVHLRWAKRHPWLISHRHDVRCC